MYDDNIELARAYFLWIKHVTINYHSITDITSRYGYAATLAKFENIKQQLFKEELNHGILAFGGGALLSAVSLVLVPDAIVHLTVLPAAVLFLAGGLCFMWLDMWLSKTNTPASQLTAMLVDFIPETLALGAAFAISHESALLLAALIALQNIPEGFNAYQELKESSSYSDVKIILFFTLCAMLGPIAGVSGYLWLSEHHIFVSAVMLFAAGGILYSVFQDIAPKVPLKKHWLPPMGAVLGFIVGVVGKMLII
jgi:ZIP family zinc transporter